MHPPDRQNPVEIVFNLPDQSALLARNHGEQVAARAGRVAIAAQQPAQQGVIFARLAAKIGDVPCAVFQISLLGRPFQRFVDPAILIDQPDLACSAAIPDASLANGVDLLDRQIARFCHAGDEVGIAVFDRALQDGIDFRSEAGNQIRLAGQRRGADTVAIHAEVSRRPLECRDDRENADRAGYRFRLGKNPVCGC